MNKYEVVYIIDPAVEEEARKELERNLQISESVIRYQVIRLEEKKVGIKPRAVRVAAPVAPVEAPAETPAAE